MPTNRPPPRVVLRDGNRIRFVGRVNGLAHRQFMWCLHDCRQRGYEDIVLDFSSCESAFPIGMIPLLAVTDRLRRESIDISTVLPSNVTLERLFLNANWAHMLQPTRFMESDTIHDRHLAARRFRDLDEQQQLVNDFMEVVIRSMELDREVLAGLEWSVSEITDNVLNHAECEDGGIAQVSTFTESRKVAFGVADSGRGVLASLSQGHADLRDDAHAIAFAMEAGVTRDVDVGQGNGLAGGMRIATMSGGSFEITSGLAQIVVRPDGSRNYKRRQPMHFRGTSVYSEIRLDTTFQLSDALGFSGEYQQPVDFIEVLYETDSGDAVVLRLRQESVGFGSRRGGQQLRTKCLNLLRAEPSKPLLLDWTGIALVSSSFADELVGKLFASLGPTGFSARVRNIGMESVVRGLVDKAIMERIAQVTTVALNTSNGTT